MPQGHRGTVGLWSTDKPPGSLADIGETVTRADENIDVLLQHIHCGIQDGFSHCAAFEFYNGCNGSGRFVQKTIALLSSYELTLVLSSFFGSRLAYWSISLPILAGAVASTTLAVTSRCRGIASFARVEPRFTAIKKHLFPTSCRKVNVLSRQYGLEFTSACDCPDLEAA